VADVARRDLQDLTIIDFTTMIAGPTLTRLFGELGANVIHVEPPAGDDGRNSTTPYLGREGIFYSIANRSKRGIELDLGAPGGADALLRMLEQADIFVENARPGTLARYGLDYESVHARIPSLIYVSITGWGTSGPMAELPGYDILVQAFSGAMVPDTDGMPQFNGSLIGDPTAPLIGAFATMVALRNRASTGVGSHVTTSLIQGALHVLGTSAMLVEDDPSPPPDRSGRARLPGGAGVFQTSDGAWTVICAWTDGQFRQLCELADLPHLADDPAYATRSMRIEEAVPLNEVFAEWACTFDQLALLATLRDAGIPCSPVNQGFGSLQRQEAMRANGIIIAVDHPSLGRLWQAGPGFEIDGEPPEVRAAPRQGEHTAEVLQEFGIAQNS
jgi:formyl-CoA transferase